MHNKDNDMLKNLFTFEFKYAPEINIKICILSIRIAVNYYRH